MITLPSLKRGPQPDPFYFKEKKNLILNLNHFMKEDVIEYY